MTISVVALSGGVGGAKLASGLSRVVAPGNLLVAANTGDDFTHMGLHISPDIDSIFYAVTDLNNTETGWGRVGETWNFMAALKEFGGEDWFNLGDSDLAMHVLRSHWLRQGKSLSEVTDRFCQAMKVSFKLAPMSDDPVATMIESDRGTLPMQDYFVREHCEPVAKAFSYEGATEARANPELMQALKDGSLQAIIICPSNPYLSIDPIFSLSEIRDQLRAANVPVIAVSPIVGGAALKGPLGKIMAELKIEPSSLSIAKHYGDLIDALVIDESDAHECESIEALGIRAHTAPTIMKTVDDQKVLAKKVLELVGVE
ncbi:MAG: 2-phospho-L-lactate transferase [Rhodospirillales bacterium]|jgi:LPPG:FO 2-phospho-L-lactate transferase|nr:2-phospho-L-lactate transferase [Rhodospirillales bacterium]MBT4039342.1 2-phospho-L-lactate transferase [Rhodospirillales bacterium]MBT4626256.1 2-phospho-L-lactate transferase [Rhodospirillales bacterium]MBT5353075.1 2-phospho-L-lactate transferase [Rhodospirillales bacterium]MBT5520762.1 2-phospho-L-lactate transferase [Rhodospirillales bacterium]